MLKPQTQLISQMIITSYMSIDSAQSTDTTY